MKGLTEGRIVHYVLDDGEHRPAIVVKVWGVPTSGPDNGCCNLQVFTDFENDRVHVAEGLRAESASGHLWATSRFNDELEKKPGTWHWIEPA